jgi:hypothetical protein
MQPATCEKLVDDTRVIITRLTLPVGTETGHHVHQYNYALGSPLKYIDPDGHESKEACGYYGGGKCGIATSNIQIQTLNKAWDCNLCWDKRQQIDNVYG